MAREKYKVMLALDDSEHSDAVLESVSARPWPEPTEFLVFVVLEPYHPELTGWSSESIDGALRYAEQLRENTCKYASRCADELKSKFGKSKVEFVIEETAQIKEAIINKASKWQADMLVMGSHGKTGLKRLLLGSVSRAVLAHAPCSVEVVKRPAAQSSN